MVREIRRDDAATPIVLMGYANPIEAMGPAVFADRAKAAGVDGVLVVDYPPEEAREFAALLEARGLAPIFLHLTHDAPAAHRRHRGGRARLRLLRLAQGRDGRGPPRHRRGRREARRDPQAREAAGGGGLRHPRRGERARGGGRRGRGGDRQPHHPGDRGRRRRSCARRAPARGSPESVAHSTRRAGVRRRRCNDGAGCRSCFRRASSSPGDNFFKIAAFSTDEVWRTPGAPDKCREGPFERIDRTSARNVSFTTFCNSPAMNRRLANSTLNLSVLF